MLPSVVVALYAGRAGEWALGLVGAGPPSFVESIFMKFAFRRMPLLGHPCPLSHRDPIRFRLPMIPGAIHRAYCATRNESEITIFPAAREGTSVALWHFAGRPSTPEKSNGTSMHFAQRQPSPCRLSSFSYSLPSRVYRTVHFYLFTSIRVCYIWRLIYCHSVCPFLSTPFRIVDLVSPPSCFFLYTIQLRTQSLKVVGRDLDESFEIARHPANGTS